jgi:hypothetical protein
MSELERKVVRLAAALALGGAMAGAGCSNDYDQFNSPDPSPAGRAGTGARPGIGGTGVGGVGGGVGGSSSGTGGVSGSGGAVGSAGAPGDGGCSVAEKLCGGNCVPRNDPNFGCASPNCDPCNFPNATVVCTNGQCSPTGCMPGFQDCDNNLQNGCEPTNQNTVTSCGACGRPCASANVATLECTNGVCSSSCVPGFANCRRPMTGADDGCEQNINTSNQNCGGCSNSCADQGNGLVCANAHCGCTTDAQCRVGGGAGTATCNLATRRCVCDAVECNEGEVCPRRNNARLCTCGNTGAACTAGQVCCDTPAGCRNLQTDATSCGACGFACPSGFICSAGRCACDADADCGSSASCVNGLCVCGAVTADAGQIDSGDDGAADSAVDDADPDATPIDSGAPDVAPPPPPPAACAPGQRCLANGMCG